MENTRPSDETRATEAEDAQIHADAGDMPTPEEEAAAERAGGVDPEVAENYEEALERGANAKGEGRVP